MLLALLIYSYATGTFSSRRIEQSTYDSVPVRLLTADTHPDHDTICTFRRENQALLTESFVKVLQLAQQLKVLKFGQLTVAVDGTKVLANASKHNAVSYERAGEMIAQLELEVQQLWPKPSRPTHAAARRVDDSRGNHPAAGTQGRAGAGPRRDRSPRPGPLRRPTGRTRKRKWPSAPPKRNAAKRWAANPRKPPRPTPEPGDQYNFTDPESRIMKAGNGNHFEQSYNAQAAVEVESRLIVGERVSQAPNDKQELVPTLAAIPAEAGSVTAALVDSGFFSEKAVRQVERAEPAPTGTLCGRGKDRAITGAWPIWKCGPNRSPRRRRRASRK
jgi:hypothetical protein